jgi:hypothetical protein
MNYSQYVRFRERAGDVLLTGSGPIWRAPGNLGQADAEYALAYAVATVLEMEDRVGNLAKPFEPVRL